MPGANSILRIIGAVLALIVVIVVTGVGYALMDPISQQTGHHPQLGWSNPNILMFAGLGLIGLTIVIIYWMIFGPIRNDVRQDVRRP